MEERQFRAFEVMRFVQRMGGKETTLYVAALPAKAILDLFDVDVFDAGSNPGGYQRRPVEYRFREIARYVLSHEGLLPTAILVNIRDAAEFVPTKDGSNTGLLRLPVEARLWVVDGQHRVYGLREARQKLAQAYGPDADLAYDLPIVFTVGLDKYQEMRLFHIVNSKNKSVPTDLAAQLLYQAVRRQGLDWFRTGLGQEKEFRKAVGTRVALHLNSTPGPWQGKIRLPNEPRNPRKPLQLNAVASSLEPALRDGFIQTIYMLQEETDNEWPRLCGLVYTFWQALAELMPEAFDSIEQYGVQRTAGVYGFHLIFPDVVHRCRDRGDFSVAGFKAVLSNLGHWVDSATWHLEHGDPLTRSTGMASIRILAATMREQLPPPETPGLPSPEGERPQEALRRAGVVYGD
jgi:DGQHR domain-containing protein